ncbi:helix-turn-helix domain-containing protein [Streptomyces sp. NPDC088261]|uniref:helix-turn-helix domain-containing protein n=1 Tax=Streptomyces sp. NPDC088261 TaxID=3365851 RepID=UPI003824B34E
MKALAKNKRVTGELREKVAADLKKEYESGAGIRTLAEEIGRSYGFTRRVLIESGVTLRGRGGNSKAKSAPRIRRTQIPHTR